MKNRRTADFTHNHDKTAAASDGHHQKTLRRIRETLERSREVLSDWGNPDTRHAGQKSDEGSTDGTGSHDRATAGDGGKDA